MQENPESVTCGAKLKGQLETVTGSQYFTKFQSLDSRYGNRRAKPVLRTVQCPAQLDDPGNDRLARKMSLEVREVGRNLETSLDRIRVSGFSVKQRVENRGGVGGGENILESFTRQLSLGVSRQVLGKSPDARHQDSIPLFPEVSAQLAVCVATPLGPEMSCAFLGERDGGMDAGGFRDFEHDQSGILDPRMGHQCFFHFREREPLFSHFNDSVCTAIQLKAMFALELDPIAGQETLE